MLPTQIIHHEGPIYATDSIEQSTECIAVVDFLQNISARDDCLQLDVHQERAGQLTVETVGLLGRRR